jgi:hypothetical protein
VANVYQTNIQIGGAVNPSLAKAIGLSQSQMALLTKSVNTFNALAKKSQLAVNGLPPSLQRANTQVNQLNAGFTKMGNIVKGVAIGDLIADGVRTAVRMIEVAIGKLEEFSSKSLDLSSKFEKSSWALGNVIGNRDIGKKLAGQLAEMGKTQFGGDTLINTAKKLSAAGVPNQNLLGTTRELANIVAGSGGGTEELATLSQAYDRVMNRGYMDPRSLQAMSRMGVPMETTLMKLFGSGDLVERDAKGNPKKIFHGNTEAEKKAKIQEMLSKRLITTAMYQQALADMVSKTGVFANGMSEHAKIFDGAVEQMGHETEFLMRKFGDLEKDALGPLVAWFNQSGIWKYASEWLDRAREWTDGVVKYFQGSGIAEKLKPIFNELQETWERFSGFLEGFFTDANTATGIERALKPSAAANLNKFFTDVAEILTSQAVKDIAEFSVDRLVFATKDVFLMIHEFVDIYSDIKTGNFGKLASDLNKYEYEIPKAAEDATKENTSAIQALTDTFASSFYSVGSGPLGIGGRGSGYMDSFNSHGRALSDSNNELYYEHPDTEGSSSQYGPNGNKLGYGYGIGIGKSKQRETGATYGKWVKVRLPNGGTIIRQVNETSARNHGIEVVTPHTDESSYGSGKATIEGVYDSKDDAEKSSKSGSSKRIRSTSTTPIVINYNIHAIDSQDVHRFASDHASTLAHHVHSELKSRMERSAVV